VLTSLWIPPDNFNFPLLEINKKEVLHFNANGLKPLLGFAILKNLTAPSANIVLLLLLMVGLALRNLVILL